MNFGAEITFLNQWVLFLLPAALGGFFLTRSGLAKAWSRTAHWEPGIKPRGLNLRPVLAFIAVFLVVVALARPVWDPQPLTTTSPGQSTVFLVDVSQSMATTDLMPSRLEAVKTGLLNLIPKLSGDEAALMAFAGVSGVRSPLSQDRLFLSQAVEALQPGSVPRGGTKIAEAINQARLNFSKGGRKLTLWLFTDGGDQGSDIETALAKVASGGHRIFIWGIGTPEGGQVPGREVDSSRNDELLSEIVQAVPGGAYFSNDLSELPQIYLANRKESPKVANTVKIYQEGAWYLLFPLGVVILLDLFLAGAPRRKK